MNSESMYPALVKKARDRVFKLLQQLSDADKNSDNSPLPTLPVQDVDSVPLTVRR